MSDADYDVVVVGGGPAGAAAAVFTAREGLETVVFDCGRSSLKRCAHLENYLGFPAGIDIETAYDLFHAHVREAGATIVTAPVESVEREADADGFVVHRQDGETVTARRLIAATRYDGEYLRGLDDAAAMFDRYEHDGQTEAFFDRAYPEADGTTPVAGLYVASPSREADMQALVAAGRGARVARRVITDARLEAGWWPEAAEGVDWLRRDGEREGRDREYWLDHFDERYGEDAPVDPDSERYRRVRETAVADRLGAYLTDDEIDQRADRGHRTLAAHLDTEAVLAAVDIDDLLDSVDDERLLDALDEQRLHDATGDSRGGEP